jgi:hypothetical protein
MGGGGGGSGVGEYFPCFRSLTLRFTYSGSLETSQTADGKKGTSLSSTHVHFASDAWRLSTRSKLRLSPQLETRYIVIAVNFD